MDTIIAFINGHPFIVTTIVLFIIGTIPVVKRVREILKDPDKLQNMTDTTFDYIDEKKAEFKDQWKTMEAMELAQIEAEDEAKRQQKEVRKQEKLAKKAAKKIND